MKEIKSIYLLPGQPPEDPAGKYVQQFNRVLEHIGNPELATLINDLAENIVAIRMQQDRILPQRESKHG